MHMKATISGKQLGTMLTIPANEWQNLGNALRLRIITRTRLQNVDANGAPFHAYSVGYAKAKAKHGGLSGGGRVNLTGTKAGPKMLDNIAVLVHAQTNPRLTLRFASAGKAQIALYHMGEGRVDREFFALSEDDVDYSVNYLKGRLRLTRGL
jgi:hypothetical protein